MYLPPKKSDAYFPKAKNQKVQILLVLPSLAQTKVILLIKPSDCRLLHAYDLRLNTFSANVVRQVGR